MLCKVKILKYCTPVQVYSSLHHVLLRYGKTLEDYVHSVAASKNTPPEETARAIEDLYDKIRGIIIHDSTSVSLPLQLYNMNFYFFM